MAAGRGSSFDSGPSACPFIALELDRDRRSERPDYRHRCYAEQVPAPRTIAHQERYCLSPNFSGCPIFQDWALRAAARPVPLPPGYEGRNVPPDPRSMAGGMGAGAATAGAAAAAGDVWPDSMESDVPPAADAASAQQLSAFDAGEAPAPSPPAPPPAPVEEPVEAAPPVPPTPPPPAEPHASPDFEPEDAAVPAFLAGRSSRPPRPPDPADGKPRREEVVPSWELTDQYGAQGGGDTGDDGFFKRFLTMIAVVVILALGVAAVVILPNMLGGTAASTARPSLPARSLGSLQPSGSAPLASPTLAATSTPAATAAPTVEPTPAATPRLYKIKSGDTMAKIARKFGITVADILFANPEIPDANHIEVGQFIIIPLPLVPPPS